MTTALLVIDAQNIYTNPSSELHCEDAKSTIGRINKLVKKFEQKDLPIILIRHVHKSDGSDLGRMFDYLGEAEEDFDFKEGTEEVEYDNKLHQPGSAIHVVKTRYSAFVNTDLDQVLKQKEVGAVVICGFMTNFCCESTARDAHDRDYFVDFIIDATGTPGTENYGQADLRRTVADVMESGISRVSKTDEYLESLG